MRLLSEGSHQELATNQPEVNWTVTGAEKQRDTDRIIVIAAKCIAVYLARMGISSLDAMQHTAAKLKHCRLCLIVEPVQKKK